MTDYRLTSGDPDPAAVSQLTFVLFMPDGRCAAIPDGTGARLPTGAVRAGEDYLLDTALRVPLEQAGFRPQRIHPFATAGTHVYAWLHGDRYAGRRPHATVNLVTGTPSEIALLLNTSTHPVAARAVLDAAHSFHTQSDDDYYADNLRLLEPAYLRGTTPQQGSGFGGDATRWRARREPILAGIHRSGTFLDLGCANGLLMESVHAWSAERGQSIEPYGVDISPRLVDRARHRLPRWATRITVGNAITHRPQPPNPTRYTFVHALLDFVPTNRRADLIHHTLTLVEPGGRLLISHYTTDGGTDLSAADHLRTLGFPPAGHSPTTAWLNAPT